MRKFFLSLFLIVSLGCLFSSDLMLNDLKLKLENNRLKPEEQVELLLKFGNFAKEVPAQERLDYANKAEQICNNAQLDELKVKVYFWKSKLLGKLNSFDDALLYFEKARELANKIDKPEVTGYMHYYSGIHYIYAGNYKSSRKELLKSLDYFEFLTDKDKLRAYNNLANIYYYYSDYAPSISYYLKQRDLAERLEIKKEQAFAYVGMGNIYNELDNLEKARDYYLKAIKRFEEINEPLNVYSVENNLGTVYSKMNDHDHAEEIFNIVKEKAKKFDDKETIYYAELNLGMIEMLHKKNYEKALQYFKLAEKYVDNIAFDREIAMLYLDYGTTLYHLKKYDQAIDYLDKSYAVAEKIVNYSIMEDILEMMMLISLAQNDFYKMAETLEKYLDHSLDKDADSIMDVSQIHQQYNREKFDHQLMIFQQNEEINLLKMQQQQRITFFVIVFLFFIVIAFFYVIYTNRQLKLMKESLEIRVKENLDKLHAQDSLLIMQNHQAAMGEMLSMIAHQWKQPLNSIGLISQNLEDAYDFNEFNEEMLHNSVKNIMDQISLMANTLNSFRDYYKMGDDKKFLLSTAVRSSFEYCEPLFRKYKINYNFENVKDYEIFGQMNLLIQVFLSLIVNSRDAFEENDISNREIIVESTPYKEDQIKINVIDNAGGIPENVISKVFEPYFTTKEPAKGTGIGLYICKSVVREKFNGSIKVSKHDNGSMFSIILPLYKETDPSLN